MNRGLKSPYIPDPNADVGHCVHQIAMHRSGQGALFMQKHWDVMRSDDAGESWHEISGNLPTDFGYTIAVHAHEPDTVYVVPITSDSEPFRRMEGWACTEAARADTSGRRLRKGCRNATATSMCCSTLWPSIRSIRVASTSAPPVASCTCLRMAETGGRSLSEIFRLCYPSRSRRCHD